MNTTYGKASATAKLAHPINPEFPDKCYCGKAVPVAVPAESVDLSLVCLKGTKVMQAWQTSTDTPVTPTVMELTLIDSAAILAKVSDATPADTGTEDNDMADTTETAAQKNKRVKEEVAANIERLRSLAEAENAEGAQELYEETDALVAQLPMGQRPKLRKEMEEARTVVEDKPADKPSKDVAVVVTDYMEINGGKDAVERAAATFVEGVSLDLKASDVARSIAETMVGLREKITHDGSPDLKAKSPASAKAGRDMKIVTLEKLAAAHPEMDRTDVEMRVEKMWKSYQNKTSDVLADLANGMDSDPEAFRARFPKAAEAHPDMRPAEAMSHFFSIDLEGHTVKMRKRAQAKALEVKAAAAITDGKTEEAEKLQAEAAELLGKPVKTPDEIAAESAKKILAASKSLSVEQITGLDDAAKKAQREALQEALDNLKALIGATL